MDVGFIGLGNIGAPCAKHLVDAGHSVTVFDIEKSASRRYLLAAKAGLDIVELLRVLRSSSAGLYMPLADMIVKRQWETSNYDRNDGAIAFTGRPRSSNGDMIGAGLAAF